ncbi:hypothetical protein Q7P37_002387 [Cladosporium fusiforme]
MVSTLVTLPEDILHIICSYLSIQSLKSASQAHRSLSEVYQHYCHQTLRLDVRSEHPWEKFELIERWDRDDRLKNIRNLLVNDSGPRSRDGNALLQLALSQALPKMTGLRRVHWNLSGRLAPLGEDFRFPDLPPKVRLEVQAAETAAAEPSAPVMSQILSGVQHHSSLLSLDISFDGAAPQLHRLFRTALSTCTQLRSLRVRAVSGALLGQNDTSLTGHRWSPDEVASFPALEELSFDYFVMSDEDLDTWATYGNWSSLKKLILRGPRLLQFLMGRCPVLQTVSVGALSWLGEFLEQSPRVEFLTVTGLRNHQKGADLRAILASPVGARLKSLEVRLLHEKLSQKSLGIASFDLKAVAGACPQLRHLVWSIEPDQYQSANGTLHWQETCVQVVAALPQLRHFAVVIPHVLFTQATASSQFVTFSTADALWTELSSGARTLEKLCVIASLEHERTLYKSGSWNRSAHSTKTLTFVAEPAEKDWDAQQGEYTVDCLELSQAEELLTRGDLHSICNTGRYVDARKRVDDLTSLAERGYVVQKKPPRAMPDYLTAAEEEDSRSSPTRRRRAKRRINSAIDLFFDNFKPYNVESDTQLTPQQMSASLDPPAARRQVAKPFLKRWSR